MSKVMSSKELLPLANNIQITTEVRSIKKKSEQGYRLNYIYSSWPNAWNILSDNECLHKEEKKEEREERGNFITKREEDILGFQLSLQT